MLKPLIVPSMKGVQHRGVLHAHRDDQAFGHDDRQRDRLVPVTSPTLFDGRDIDDDHRVSVLDIDARAFLIIKRCAQIGEIDAGRLRDIGKFDI